MGVGEGNVFATTVGPRDPLINYEIEMALLGALLAQNLLYDRIYQIVSPEMFADPLHGRIYDAMAKLIVQGKSADPRTLKGLFDNDRALLHSGGGSYLSKLYEATVVIINAEDYARGVRELYLRRQVRDLTMEMGAKIRVVDWQTSVNQLTTEFEGRLYEIGSRSTSEDTHQVFPASVYLREAMSQLTAASVQRHEGKVIGISSSLRALDEQIGGFMPGKQYVLAGRPGMGKSALVINIAHRASKEGKIIYFVTPEMSRTEVGCRRISIESMLNAFRGTTGMWGQAELEHAQDVVSKMEEDPFYVDDTVAPTIAEIAIKARQMKRKVGLDMIVVDYIQLVYPTRVTDNRAQDIGSITRSLKELAKMLDVPVLALSQLSRNLESREDKRPVLSDLRESGAIEQDADVVIFVYREAYYLQQSKPKQDSEAFPEWNAKYAKVDGLADLIVAKQRSGPVGTVAVAFDDKTTLFEDRPGVKNSTPVYDGPEDQSDLLPV